MPWHPVGRRVWSRLLPVALFRFDLLPAQFLVLGAWFWFSALCNVVLAELICNLHTMAIIVTNHTGEDMPRFATPMTDKEEFYLRQIISAVNFRTGGDLNDFLHGYLNYQIEHHVWPDLSMRQYQRAQPRLEALCEKHGIPYRQESVWTRIRKTVAVVVGRRDMLRFEELQSPS
jgi:fatty acid desaturase